MFTCRLRGSSLFFEAEPCFAVKVISRLCSLRIGKISQIHLITIEHIALNYYFRITCEFAFILFRGSPKVKLGKNLITVVGIYRPPSFPMPVWTNELPLLFDAASTLTSTVTYCLLCGGGHSKNKNIGNTSRLNSE